MSTHAVGPGTAAEVRVWNGLSVHWAWPAGGFPLVFAVPYVLADTLELNRDIFYRLYALACSGRSRPGTTSSLRPGATGSPLPCSARAASNRRFSGKVAIGAVAPAASLAMTAAYHAGYSDFRTEKMQKPLIGDTMWSVPTLVTLNPIGAPIAHVGLHTSAVLRSYETDTSLPPHQ